MIIITSDSFLVITPYKVILLHYQMIIYLHSYLSTYIGLKIYYGEKIKL